MILIASRMVVGTTILMVIPLSTWLFGWQWQPKQNTCWLYILFFITETVTKPWGVITHIVLCSWFLWCLRFCLRSAVILIMIITGTILVGQGIKSCIKNYFQEPRPFIVWLEKIHYMPINQFRILKHKDRTQLIKKQLAKQHNIPTFLQQHWQKETEFAFPSGHTIFATSWALLSISLLWIQRRIITIIILFFWAICVISSRLLLGMHWCSDLVAAILISWILVIMANCLMRYTCKHSIFIK